MYISNEILEQEKESNIMIVI